MQETWVQSLDQEDPLEKEIATHLSILAWEILWTKEPSRLQSMGLQKVRVAKSQTQLNNNKITHLPHDPVIVLLNTCVCCVLSHPVVSDSLQPHGLKPSRLLCSWGFSRQKHWSVLSCPPPGTGDLPNSGIKTAFQALYPPSQQGSPILSERNHLTTDRMAYKTRYQTFQER